MDEWNAEITFAVEWQPVSVALRESAHLVLYSFQLKFRFHFVAFYSSLCKTQQIWYGLSLCFKLDSQTVVMIAVAGICFLFRLDLH